MKTHSDKKQDGGQRTSVQTPQIHNSQPTFQFVDNRPEAILQRKLQEGANNSPRNQQQRVIQQMANNSPQNQQQQVIQQMADNHAAQETPIQKKENKTGLPDNLKSGIENLSGYSMDDVKVHYNSEKPAQLQAHAYAQGTDIHIASGQEKHLPHEAWHVVQQKQGRVKPTMQMKGKVNINDDKGLEKEADVMGAKALQMKSTGGDNLTVSKKLSNSNDGEIFQLAPAKLSDTNVKLEQTGGDDFRVMHNPGVDGEEVKNSVGFTGILNKKDWADLGKSPGDYWRAHGYAKSFGGSGGVDNVGWWTAVSENKWTDNEQKVRGAGEAPIPGWKPYKDEKGTYKVTRTVHDAIDLKPNYVKGLMYGIKWGFDDSRAAWTRIKNLFLNGLGDHQKELKEWRLKALKEEKARILIEAQTKIETWVNALFGGDAVESNLIKTMKMEYTIDDKGTHGKPEGGESRGNHSKEIKASKPKADKFGLTYKPEKIWQELVNNNNGVFGKGAAPVNSISSRMKYPDNEYKPAVELKCYADGWGIS